jgi:EAL domain-containing protein (putative c-di-GMP-specific phosphodiesterase class I)/PAS domain-containing protein
MRDSRVEGLRRERDRFVGFAFASADLLVELDGDLHIKWASGAVRSMLGVNPDAANGLQLSQFLAQHDLILLISILAKLERGQRRRDVNLRLRANSGSGLPISLCIYRALNPAEHEYLLSGSLRPSSDVPEPLVRRRDSTTGLLEAMEFTETASNAVRAARQAGKSACFTLIEICGEGELKRLLGHERSEALMAEVGSKLRFHAVDADGAVKLGDGKFSVAHLADADPAAISAAINLVGGSYQLDPAALKLKETTIDFKGNALMEDDVEKILSYILDKFRSEGIAALETGSADAYLRKIAAETLSRVVTMRDVIHQNLLSLRYQPIVSMADRSIHHYEVLLRFEDGRSPFEDIQFAEQVNTIHEVDLAVTQGAIARIQRALAERQDLSLAVNMSARSLLNDTFLSMFEQLAAKIGENRSKLIIEITESAKLDDLAKASQAVERLAKNGHPICLDDFGAGASSLPYLQQLTVNYVKIDGAYIRGITDNVRERAIIQGVLATCKCLDIQTVAEMVEREDQHKCLLDLGVNLGQGWLYGRPAAEIAAPAARAPHRVSRRMDPKKIGQMLSRGKSQ